MEPKEKKAFEPTGLVPRSIVRTFERFRQQLLPGSEAAAIREYRISRYQVLVSARCLFALLTIPIATNWLVSNWLLSPLIEHFWNTQQNEIFLNSYQEERAFAELEFFSEKLFFESLLDSVTFTRLPSPKSLVSFERKSVNQLKESSESDKNTVLMTDLVSSSFLLPEKTILSRINAFSMPSSDLYSVATSLYPEKVKPEQNLGLARKNLNSNISVNTAQETLNKRFLQCNLALDQPKTFINFSNAFLFPLSKEVEREENNAHYLSSKVQYPKGKANKVTNFAFVSDKPFKEAVISNKHLPSQGYTFGKAKQKANFVSKRSAELNFLKASLEGSPKANEPCKQTSLEGSLKVNESQIDSQKIKKKIQEKILELALYYNQQTILSITNIVGDLISIFTLGCLFFLMRPEITILKSFLIEAIYSLSDTTKSFLLILLTDLLVGFHSPRGWETALELLLKHFGLPENQDFVFLFVATFPVLLDTVFKYWIFRHLNKISPSTVATYHSMIE